MKTYPVMFTPPGTDENGAPKGADLLAALAAEPVQEDGYAYVALGRTTREELARLASSLGGAARACARATPVPDVYSPSADQFAGCTDPELLDNTVPGGS